MRAILTQIFAVLVFVSAGAVAAQPENGVVIRPGETARPSLVDSVTVTGATATGLEFESGRMTRPGGILNDGYLNHDIGLIESTLREQGWFGAAVSVQVDSSGGDITVSFDVSPGSRAYLAGITVDSPDYDMAPSPPDSAVYGKPASREIIEGTARVIVESLARDGYPDAAVLPLLRASGDSLRIEFTVDAGARAVIDTVAVRGLTVTQPRVAGRELAFLRGEPAGTEAIAAAARALDRLTFIGMAREPYLDYSPDGRTMLVLPVEEQGQGTFDGVLGYQPGGNGEDGEIVGRVDVSFTNIIGTGRAAGFRWEDMGGGREDLDVKYREPWLFGRPYDLSVAFTQEERESLGYTRTLASGRVGRHIGNVRMEAGVRYEKVSADSLTSTSAGGFDAAASWNGLDSSDNPSRGFRAAVRWSRVTKRYRFAGTPDTDIERTEIDLAQFIPTLARQAVAVMASYRRVIAPDSRLTLADRYWIGGASTLRGYAEQQFPAVESLVATAEYRVLTGRRSRAFLFLDRGFLFNSVRDGANGFRTVTTNATGYGFGLRVTSRAGVLGFDYGLGDGGGIGSGKLHVSLRTEF